MFNFLNYKQKSTSQSSKPGNIKDAAELEHLPHGNRFIGTPPILENSTISFSGNNNILFCEPGVVISGSRIIFNGDNALVYLGQSRHKFHLSITINHSSVFHMGRNNYINGSINVILSERKHCFFGDNGVLSFGIWIRNADPHLIYSCDSGQRINPSKSIYIGDHVWLGQSAMLLKGTEIDSGSIIGAMSVAAGKKIDHNSSWAGNPIRKIADSIFWDGACVHQWDKDKTEKSQHYVDFIHSDKNLSVDSYIYQYDPAQAISYSDLDLIFDGDSTSNKLDYLIELAANPEKNRFVHTVR